jgi:hypothetical protein
VTESQRVKVGVALRPPDADLSTWLSEAAAFDAAGADALWVPNEPGADPVAVVAALAAVTHRALLVNAAPIDGRARATLDRISRDRMRERFDMEGAWLPTAIPEGRTAWAAAHRAAAEAGRTGVVVNADPRLLDLLRNPDEPGERDDLHLSVG